MKIKRIEDQKMNLERPKRGPNAGKNMVIIIVAKEMIWEVGRLFQISVVIPPLRPKTARMKLINFSNKVPKKEGIFLMVALVLFFILSQKDFSL